MKSPKIIYYETEKDRVKQFKERKIIIDENYKYIHKNPLYKLISFITYRFLATPFAFIAFKLFKKVKFHNTQILKQFSKSGYFIYCNHTNQFCDGFCPGLICFPKKPHIIVHPSNVSIPVVGKFNKMWGALPTPNTIQATKNFYKAIEHALNNNNPIAIYPEANLWPYYTKIRNFSSVSFKYPVKFNKPVFTFTTIYKKGKHNKPKIEIYVDGPFFPNINIPTKQAEEELRNIVYKKLNERAKLNEFEYVKYIKKENHD